MQPTIYPECAFCKNLAGPRTAEWDTVLAETADYVVVPSKGALVPGWLLVVSKRHFLCAGALPVENFGHLQEAIDMATKMVTKQLGPATVFEHGPQKPGTSLGCGIDHLHVHVVPLQFSLTAAVESFLPGTGWRPLARLSDLAELHRGGSSYGLVKEHAGSLLWCEPQPGIRQMFRRVIAHKVGIPEQFDYAVHPHLANVVRTIDSLKLGV